MLTFEQIEDLVVKACGDPRAAGFELAMHYLNPEDDAEQDVFRAIHWFAYSAKAGNREAREFFDCLYGTGFGLGVVQKCFWFEREIMERRAIGPTEPYSLRPILAKSRTLGLVRRVTKMASFTPEGELCRDGMEEEVQPSFFFQLSRDWRGDYFWYFPDADWICEKSPTIERHFRDRYLDGMPGAQTILVSHKRIACDNLADVLNVVRIMRPTLVATKVTQNVCAEPSRVEVIDEVIGELSYAPAHFAKYDSGDDSGRVPGAVFETTFDGVKFQLRTLDGRVTIVDYGPYESSKAYYESESQDLCEEVSDLVSVNNKLVFRDGMSAEDELDQIREELDATGYEWFYLMDGGRFSKSNLMGWKSGMPRPNVDELMSAERMADVLLARAEEIDRDASFGEDGLRVSMEVEDLWDRAEDE